MSRNEEYITFQFGSVSNRICEQWWTLEANNQFSRDEATFDEPLMSTKALFMDKAAMKPRMLMFDTTEKADMFFFDTPDTKAAHQDPKKLGLWIPDKIEKHGMVEETKGEDFIMPEKSYKALEMSGKNVQLVPIFGSQFNNYLNGREFLTSTGGMDQLEDSARFFLEKIDYLGGVHSILDVNSGFGSICKFLLTYIKDESPKAPILQVSLENSLKLQDKDMVIKEMRTVNKFIAIHDLRSCCDVYVPVNLNVVSRLPFINSKFKDPDLHLSLLLSNLTMPYRINSPKSAFADMKSYLSCLAPSPSNFLINMFAKVPDISRASPDSKDSSDTIFEYQENLQGCFFDVDFERTKKQRMTAYGESFVLRGNLDSVKYRKVNLLTPTPLCTWEHDINLHQELQSFFDPAYKEIYGFKDEITEEWELSSIPYHTVVLNHEIFRATIDQWIKKLRRVGNSTLTQYVKEDFTDEDFKELRNELNSIHDNYDSR